MISVIVLACLCMLLFVSSIYFFPTIKIKNIKLTTYIVICVTTAFIFIITRVVSIQDITHSFTADTAVNPLKILVLFFSMTFLSAYLDELGMFAYLANLACKKFKSQKSIFTILFIVISILTVFTSNDIIILTFTPFLCYFAKNSKINPLPFLLMEFFAANTLSMALLIGNPTNIYLGLNYNIDFFSYLKVMLLPSMICAILLYSILMLLFHKALRKKMEPSDLGLKIEDKVLFCFGLGHLLLSIVLMALANIIAIEMYLGSLICALSLALITLFIFLIRHQKPTLLKNLLCRLPYSLIFFLLSMFIIVIALDNVHVLKEIGNALPNNVFVYGFLANVSSNLINNIPMSVLFTEVLSYSSGNVRLVYATIIGSNLGAFLTPVGALAGIMWMNILKSLDVDFKYKDFLKYGTGLSLFLTLIALLFI